MTPDARAALLPLLRGGAPPPSAIGEELVAEARRQGMVGALRAAADRAPEGWPAPLRETLAQHHRGQLVRGLQQLQVAAEAQRLLAQEGVRSLPLKGAALAEDLYESVADRPMADVDLLVLDDFASALVCLLAAGFAVEEAADHAVCLWHRASGVHLEAHRGLASCPRLHPVDAEGWWSRRRGSSHPGPQRPSWEDLAVQLALHAAFQHGLVLSLVQYQDLRLLLEKAPLDEGVLAARAHECGAAAALACTVLAAEAVAGAPRGRAASALIERLPRRFRRWLERRLQDPLAFVSPAPAPLVRMRWELSRGRRAALLRETFRGAPSPSGEAPPGAVRRGARLARTWAASFHSRTGARPRGDEGSAAVAVAVIEDLLTSVGDVQMTVTGNCMAPALPEGSVVSLARAGERPPRLGDVVLVRLPAGLRLHRLIWGPPLAWGRWRTKGDRTPSWDPAVAPAQVLASVREADRGPAPVRAALGSLARALAAWLRSAWRSAREA